MKALLGIMSFLREQRGNAALFFGLAALPMMVAGSAAVDYTRASQARAHMQAAVDSTVSTVAREGSALSGTELVAFGRRVFDGNLPADSAVIVKDFTVRRSGRRVTIAATGQVRTAAMNMVGIDWIDIAADAHAGWTTNKIEVALVLDNGGSMAGRMGALKQAATGLLDVLQKSADDNGGFKVAIVPFTAQVNVGANEKTPDWLVFDLAGLDPADAVRPSAWSGCVADRDKPYDMDASPRIIGDQKTLYPAVKCAHRDLAALQSLTSDFSALRATIGAMQPAGNSNATIGMAWGLAALSPQSPLSKAEPFEDASLLKILIVLSDGTSAQSRFTVDGEEIEARTDKVCRTAKRSRVMIFALQIGSAASVRDCASSPPMYYALDDAAKLAPALHGIAAEIAAMRLAQ